MAFLYFLLMMIPIVVIHEFGHYWVGRKSGIQPDTFSIGFGPEIYAKTDKRGTRWRLALLPLGGFVKFAPDVEGTNFPNVEPDKPPYRAPFFGKLATILAGPVFNFIMSFVLFFFFASFNGPQSNEPVLEAVNYFETEVQPGDKITAINGESIEGMDGFYLNSGTNEAFVKVTLERQDDYVNLELPNPNLPIVGAVIPGEPAEIAGLMEGDQIVKVNGVDVYSRDAVVDAVKEGETVRLEVLREGEPQAFDVTPEMTNDGIPRVGVYFASVYTTKEEPLGLWDSTRYAFASTNWVLVESYKGIRDLITGDIGIEAMSGPVGMSRIASDAASQGFWTFIWLMGMISSAIGFLNLLPIPILDGGHVVLMTYERIFGRLPPQFVMNLLFLLGISLLMGVLMFTTVNEIFG